MNAALPVLRLQRSDHIVQISSVGGRIGGTPGMSACQTSKFAVEEFSEVLNNEVRPPGIKVTIVEPGGFRTGWRGSSRGSPPSARTRGDRREVIEFRRATDGTQPGDPARAAQVIAGLPELEDPPLRLLLGSDAPNLDPGHEPPRPKAGPA